MRACVLSAAIGLVGVLGGCKDDGSPDADDVAETSGGPVDEPAPDFLEPAGGELHVSVMQFEDLEIDVAVAEGATELLFDGVSVGTLSSPNPFGLLTADLLRLHMTGGLVPASHAMQMRTYDPIETEVSEVIDVFIEAEPPPAIEVTLADAIVAEGDTIVAFGPGERGMLATVDGVEQRATLFAAESQRWDTTAGFGVALPGYTVALADRSPAVAIERVEHDPTALLVAWRVGHPGTRIDTVGVRWGDEAGTPNTALALDPSWIGSFETAALDQPVIAAGLLLAELEAHADAEEPRRGDRALAMVRLAADGTPGTPARAQLSAPAGPLTMDATPGLVDVDALAPALDPAGAGAGVSVALGVRLAGRSAVLDVDRSSRTIAVRPSATADSFGALDDLDGSLFTLLGAFGSRTVVGATTEAEVVALALLDDRGAAGVNDASIDLGDVELDRPTGPPALGLLGGATIVVVPFGVDRPLLVALVVAADPTLVLVGEVGCDEVALPQTSAGNAGGAVAFACLQERDVRVGTIALSLSPD